MPGSNPYTRKPVAGQCLGKTVTLGVSHTRTGKNFYQPIVITNGGCFELRIGDDLFETKSLDCRVKLRGLGTGDEIKASMGHTTRVRPEVLQNLPQCAGLRINSLVMGNNLERPDRFRGHVPP